MNENGLRDFFYKEISYSIDNLICEIKKLPFNNLQDIMIFIGIFEDENGKRQLVVPKIMDIKSFLVNVHEYTHEIVCEKSNENINYDDDYSEVIAITMERFYVTKYYQNYLPKLNDSQLEKLEYYMTNPNYFYRYILAYYYQFILIDKYYNNISMIFNHKFNFLPENINTISYKTLNLLKRQKL